MACSSSDSGSNSSSSGSDPTTGAGGGSDPDDTDVIINAQPAVGGNFNFLGYVDIIEDRLESRVNHDSNFFAMRQSTSTTDFLSVPPAPGQCRLRILDVFPSDAGTIGFPEQPFDLASAGETMTLTSDTGTYATVVFADSRFDIGPFPAPEILSVDLPGAVFPAFSDVDVPPLNLPTDFTLSTGQALTAETVFTWTAGSSADNTLHLRLNTIAAGKFVEMSCRMTDDGDFELPANVEQALSSELGADFSLEDVELQRKAVTIVTEGDALLVVSRVGQ